MTPLSWAVIGIIIGFGAFSFAVIKLYPAFKSNHKKDNGISR